MILLWLAWFAEARKPAVEPMAAAHDAAEVEACARDVPEGFQIHTGYATDPDPATAIAGAQRDARGKALDALCAGKSEARCAVIRRHVEEWKTAFHHPISGRACAHVGVARQWIDDDRADLSALLDGLRDLAERVVTAVGPRPVVLAPVRWSVSGCDAGEVGVALHAELHDALARAGRPVVAPGTRAAATVRASVDLVGAEVVLRVLVDGIDAGALPIEGLRFPADLYAVDGAGGDCRLDRQLGLDGGQRAGAGGLRVWVDDGVEGTVCDGESGEPVVTVSAPSRVKVWSVDRTGSAWLVWPPPGHDGAVEHTLALGRVTWHPPPAGGEERLLAVAVPKGQGFGPIDGWTGFCRHPATLDASAWPKAAAVGTSALTVLPWSAPACAQRALARPGPAPVPEVPICPERLGQP